MIITCRLGRVSSPTEGVKIKGLDSSMGNSNRWILDIEAPGDSEVELVLLDYRSRKPKPQGLLAPHAVPMNPTGALASVFFPEPDKLVLCVLRGDDKQQEPARFRLTVDALHSLMR